MMVGKRISKNGVLVKYCKNESLHSFNISLYVRAGSMYEDVSENGISHLFEHSAIRNVNKSMNYKLYSTLDAKGLEFNASTYSEFIHFYIGGSSLSFSSAAEIICRLLLPISLSSEELSREKKRVKAEIRENDERRSLANFTSEIVFGGTTLANPIIGTNKTVGKISLSSLRAFMNKYVNRENIFFFVSGSFKDEEIDFLTSLISEYDIPNGVKLENKPKVPEKMFKREVGVHIKNADFTMLRFTFDLDMTRLTLPETDLIYDILLSGYNSKLFVDMSEDKGLFYDVGGAVERFSNIGTLYFSVEVAQRDVYLATEMIIGIIRSLKERELPEEECMRAGYTLNSDMLLDDARELNFTLAYDTEIIGAPYESLADRRLAYERVSPADVRRAAEEIFKRENLTLTLKGARSKIDASRLEEIISSL